MAQYTTSTGSGGPAKDTQIDASDILNHTHNVTVNFQSFINKEVAFNSMPDFTRAQVMQCNTDTYAATPGYIYKINVPGYFFVGMRYSGYGDQIDMFIKLAKRPWYLFRHQNNDSKYGSYARPSYQDYSFKYGGWVNGAYYIMNMIPINPGISTYMRWCDASSYNHGKQPSFIPCAGVPTSIKPVNFYTKVAVGQSQISSGNENDGGDMKQGCRIFGGSWRDCFDSNNNLIKTAAKGYYTFIGRIYCKNGHHNGSVFYPVDPNMDNKSKTNIIYWCSGSTWIMRYITAAQSATIASGLGTNASKTFKLTNGTTYTYKQLAELLANRWAIVHHTFDKQTAYNKMHYVTHFQPSTNSGNPIAGTWLRGPQCGHAKDIEISYQVLG